MPFYAKNFTYDDQPSEFYGIQIASLDSGGAESTMGSGDVAIIQDFIFRRPVPYFYGIHYDQTMSFPVSFFSENEITSDFLSYIQNWLFGKLEYKKLAIIQPDMDYFYFNCIFTKPEVIRVGNVIYGISGICTLDSQFGWEYPKTATYNFSPSPYSGSNIVFYNNSHYSGYLYPEISFTMDSSGSSVSITNYTDGSRVFSFSGLSASEVVTVNNDLCIVESSLGVPRLSAFNKNFFRFAPGINHISVSGSISQLNITYQFARRLG